MAEYCDESIKTLNKNEWKSEFINCGLEGKEQKMFC